MDLDLIYEIGCGSAVVVGAYLMGYIRGILRTTNNTNEKLKELMEDKIHV